MGYAKTVKLIDILIVEDNPGDVDLIRDAFENSKIINKLHAVSDGQAAMDFLGRRGKYKDAPRPELILLDLNLPKKDGREVLAEIKDDEELKRIPVVVLTSSSSEMDILKSYNLHANSYITKPIDLPQFIKAIKSIENYWLSIVKLPPDGEDK
jgi:CheY-like chemotaxis protein